jgi:peroxiredoxin/mono/diheme cytochrome c family protein
MNSMKRAVWMMAAMAAGVWGLSQLAGGELQPKIGEKVADFTLQDFRGADHSLRSLEDKKLVVLAFVVTECPLAKLYMPTLVSLAKKYEERGVAVLGISSNQQDSITELAAFARVHEAKFPILKDLRNDLADKVGAQRTPEVFVLDAQRTIRYAGRIDDHYAIGVQRRETTSRDLEQALDELLADKQVSNPRTETVGCLIGRVRQPKAAASVTYSKQIARIFQNRCEECHRPGEIAPFALSNYDEAVGWAEMIDEVVQQQRMPPWHADPKHGIFSNDRRLSDEEKQLLHQWVVDGAPQGNPADLPAPRQYVVGWQLPHAPDQTFYMSEEPTRIPAEGEVKYQHFTIDPGFKEDKWVRAAQVLPGNRSVVHHIIVYVIPPNARPGAAGRQHFIAYVPGYTSEPFPDGVAKRIPAGSRLVFQIHYTPNGTPQTDRSQVGFIYANADEIKQQMVTNVAGDAGFVIPPNEPNHRVDATSVTYSKDVHLISLSPHMHFRGKSFRYEAQYPDGKTETLLDVPRYDFNWQTHYNLAEPKLLPAGTTLHCVAYFDNSADNLANPDPTKRVRWGEQTWEEMMLGYYEVAFSGEAPSGALDGTGSIAGLEGGGLGRFANANAKELAKRLDMNRDGKVTQDELPALLQRVFDRLDANKNKELDEPELEAVLSKIRQPNQ